MFFEVSAWRRPETECRAEVAIVPCRDGDCIFPYYGADVAAPADDIRPRYRGLPYCSIVLPLASHPDGADCAEAPYPCSSGVRFRRAMAKAARFDLRAAAPRAAGDS